MPSEIVASLAGAVQASLSVLLTISYGVLAAQINLLDERSAKKISKWCVNMLLPALLIVNLGSEMELDTVSRYVPILAWALFYNIASWAIGAAGTRLLSLPKWVTPAVTFNNATSLPLLLIQSLGSTGTLSQLSGSGDDVDSIVKRAKAYFLVASIIGNAMTFGLGGEMLGIYDEDPADEVEQHLRENSDDHEPHNQDEDADEHTSLLPSYVNRHKKTVVGKTYSALANAWDNSPEWVKKATGWTGRFLSPPGIGAILGIVLGIIPPVHRLLFNEASDGGYLNAWLTTSLKNIGELFVVLQVVVVGVKLAVSLRRMKRGESSGKLPPVAVIFTLFVRFIFWPAVSISIIGVLAAKTEVLGKDPVLWFTMMLMPTGPSAMKLAALADVGGAGDEEKMAIAKFLTLSYGLSPLISLTVVGALKAITQWVH